MAGHAVLDEFEKLKTPNERIEFLGNLRFAFEDSDPTEAMRLNDDCILLVRHHYLGIAYRKASYAPWTLVEKHLPSDAQPPVNP